MKKFSFIFFLSIIFVVAYQNCSKVKFSAEMPSLEIPQISGDCDNGETIQCFAQNGLGRQTCSASNQWGDCETLLCDAGYTLVNGACVLTSCPFGQGGENSCSNPTTVGYGLCGTSGKGVNTCNELYCRQNEISVLGTDCPISCSENSLCHERNGEGAQHCGNGKTCELTRCEEGFTYDANFKICVSTECSSGQKKNCDTEWGVGQRKCSAGRLDVICEPNVCPVNFTRTLVNGYYTCLPNLCGLNQFRNASGACVTLAYTWEVGNYGSCNCSTGKKTRSVICKNNQGQTVADSFCSSPKPDTQAACSDGCGPTCPTTAPITTSAGATVGTATVTNNGTSCVCSNGLTYSATPSPHCSLNCIDPTMSGPYQDSSGNYYCSKCKDLGYGRPGIYDSATNWCHYCSSNYGQVEWTATNTCYYPGTYGYTGSTGACTSSPYNPVEGNYCGFNRSGFGFVLTQPFSYTDESGTAWGYDKRTNINNSERATYHYWVWWTGGSGGGGSGGGPGSGGGIITGGAQ